MTKRNTSKGSEMAQMHRTQRVGVVPEGLGRTSEKRDTYNPHSFARELLRKLYPGLTIEQTLVTVRHLDKIEYGAYDPHDEDPLSFGQIHILDISDKLSESGIRGSLVTVEMDRDYDSAALHLTLAMAKNRMSGYHPAGLRSLALVHENPRLLTRDTAVALNKGIIFPGALIRNVRGVWCVPMIQIGEDQAPVVELMPLLEITQGKVMLYLTI